MILNNLEQITSENFMVSRLSGRSINDLQLSFFIYLKTDIICVK